MIRLALFLAALTAATTAAPAATLTATPTFENTDFSGFEFEFDDTNGNGLMDLTEIRGFGGVTQTQFSVFPADQSSFLAIPQIDGFVVAGTMPGISAPPGYWMFSADPSAGPQTLQEATSWTYAFGLGAGGPDPVSPVPLPTSALLLVTAGAGLLARRQGPRSRRPSAMPWAGCM